jgi:hypothetical protein
MAGEQGANALDYRCTPAHTRLAKSDSALSEASAGRQPAVSSLRTRDRRSLCPNEV